MSGKISIVIATTIFACLLSACGKEPPKCSDDETFSLVRKIIIDQLGGGKGLSEKEIVDNMRIEFSRATAFDEKIKRYSCEAKLTVGGVYEIPINYESQLDDKNEHIVSVGGFRRSDLFSLQAGMVEGIKKSRAEKITTPQPSEVPATTKTSGQSAPPTAQTGTPIEIDIKNEVDIKDGTYIAKEYGGQGRFTLITHSHGRFDGGDIAQAICTDGFVVSNLPTKFDHIKQILKPNDFILTQCSEGK